MLRRKKRRCWCATSFFSALVAFASALSRSTETWIWAPGLPGQPGQPSKQPGIRPATLRRRVLRSKSVRRATKGYDSEPGDDSAASSRFSPLLLASATGILTGAIVVVLNDFVHLLQDFLLDLPGGLDSLAPVLSASLVSLLLFFRGPRGLTGDSQLEILKRNGGIPSSDTAEAPLRALAAGLTLAGGNSLGPESPSVEIGANVAATLAGPRYDSQESEVDKTFRNNLLAAGCASGIAAGFNAPIAGLFFALESVAPMNYGPEETRARGPPMQLLAAVLAATVSQLGLGSSPAVDLDFFGWVPARSLWELPFFVILGLLCGLVAAALRSLRQVGSKVFAAAEEAGCPRYLFPIVAGILVAIVTFSESTKEVLYKGFANVNLVLEYADGGKQPFFTGDPLLHLMILLVCKILLTAFCQSSGQVGGLFAPALFMGACLGGLSGRALRDNFWPWAINLPFLGIEKAFSVPATYAVVGMAACLGSICRVPVTSVVLLLELAGGKDYGVVLPTVAATGVAVYVELLCRSPELLNAWRSTFSGVVGTVDALSAEAVMDAAQGAKSRSVLCAIPPGRVELSPESAATVVPSCLLLEDARDELLRSGGCLAVVEESKETSGRTQPTQRLLGVVSLADVVKALEAE